jgi:hypothetical protein
MVSQKEYTEKDAYADYGRLLALRDLRIGHSELADDTWCNDYSIAIVENMRKNGWDVDTALYLYEKDNEKMGGDINGNNTKK